MTTTLTPSRAAGGIMGAPPVAAPSSGWAGPARENGGAFTVGRLRRVIEYIQQNLDKDLPLAELAACADVSAALRRRWRSRTITVPGRRWTASRIR